MAAERTMRHRCHAAKTFITLNSNFTFPPGTATERSRTRLHVSSLHASSNNAMPPLFPAGLYKICDRVKKNVTHQVRRAQPRVQLGERDVAHKEPNRDKAVTFNSVWENDSASVTSALHHDRCWKTKHTFFKALNMQTRTKQVKTQRLLKVQCAGFSRV